MDAERFSLEHPLVEEVEVLIPDLLGIARGKRIPVDRLPDLLDGRFTLSSTVYALDVRGENVDGTPLVDEEGDADRPLSAVPGSLRPAPWRPDRALVLAGLVEPSGAPFFADPRAVLARVVAELERRGLRACAAFEYEFYLLDAEPGPDGRPRPPRSARHGGRPELVEVYDLERLAEADGFLDLLGRYCEALELPVEAVSAEYAPGQFEVNLHHRDDPLRAADDAFLFRIAVRRAARGVGLRATFAAKPFTRWAGSGCHLHLSLYDREGVLSAHLGRRFTAHYRLARACEHERFRREVSDVDLAWYLPVL